MKQLRSNPKRRLAQVLPLVLSNDRIVTCEPLAKARVQPPYVSTVVYACSSIVPRVFPSDGLHLATLHGTTKLYWTDHNTCTFQYKNEMFHCVCVCVCVCVMLTVYHCFILQTARCGIPFDGLFGPSSEHTQSRRCRVQ